LQDNVEKIPYTLEAMNCHYDITKPQPQLFVTPDFPHLMKVLSEFRQLMAWTLGGLHGINKAIESQQTSTVVFSSGLQVTGTFFDVMTANGDPIFVRTDGPTALAENEKQLPGYSKHRLHSGLATPIGDLLSTAVPFEDLEDADLNKLKIITGQEVQIHFASGVSVAADKVIEIKRSESGKILLINFANARLQHEGKILWQSDAYTMPVGSKIISAFAGPADIEAFEPTAAVPREKMHKIIHSTSAVRLQLHYRDVRTMREGGSINAGQLETIFRVVQRDFTNDWLLHLEILELLQCNALRAELQSEIRNYLEAKAAARPDLEQLILNGLELLKDNPVKLGIGSSR